MEFIHTLIVPAGVLFSKYSGFLSQVKNINVGLNENLKLILIVSVCMHCCLSCVSVCWLCDGVPICLGCTPFFTQ